MDEWLHEVNNSNPFFEIKIALSIALCNGFNTAAIKSVDGHDRVNGDKFNFLA